MVHPVAGYPITTGYKKTGSMWSLGYHTGVDYACPIGTNVLAPATGKIIRTSYDSAYGNYILGETIIGGVPYRWYLCHLSKFLTTAGASVQTGQHVGESGNTGNTSGPHCHLEVRKSPYGFNSKDIIDPAIMYNYAGGIAPTPQVDFYDATWWSQAAARYFGKPWLPRVPGIGREIRGEASVYGFSELYTESDALDVLHQLNSSENVDGTNFKRSAPAGRAGLEFMYNADYWTLGEEATNYSSGIQSRFAYKVPLIRRKTGKKINFVLVHGPVQIDSYKTQYGIWLKNLLPKLDDSGPVHLMGDVNRSVRSRSPRKEIAEAGYRDMRQQTTVTNASMEEFPGSGWLADHWSIPGKLDFVTPSELDPVDPNLSDHRELDVRVRVPA